MTKEQRKVFVGMSGGVDSSVSAALLLQDGYEVVGVFIKVWQADFLPCTWREERRDAMRAAAHLGIPLITLDLEKEYKKEVVDYMIKEYEAGRVPNPDVMCNKHVKFGAFLDFAKKNGADAIATGHYARIIHGEGSTQYKLLMGKDKQKDQSYFLWTLTQEQLTHTLFPVGHLEKSEVRKLAKKFGLPNAEKKDSQGLCFMGAVDMKDFLKHYIDAKQGNVLDEGGQIIGSHDGAVLYALGQRHGFRTTKLHTNESPLFVIAKDVAQNTITVGTRSNHSAVCSNDEIALVDTQFRSHEDKEPPLHMARIRYRGNLYPVTLIKNESKVVAVRLGQIDEYVSPGQSVVVYVGEECIGGGVVA